MDTSGRVGSDSDGGSRHKAAFGQKDVRQEWRDRKAQKVDAYSFDECSERGKYVRGGVSK